MIHEDYLPEGVAAKLDRIEDRESKFEKAEAVAHEELCQGIIANPVLFMSEALPNADDDWLDSHILAAREWARLMAVNEDAASLRHPEMHLALFKCFVEVRDVRAEWGMNA